MLTGFTMAHHAIRHGGVLHVAREHARRAKGQRWHVIACSVGAAEQTAVTARP